MELLFERLGTLPDGKTLRFHAAAHGALLQEAAEGFPADPENNGWAVPPGENTGVVRRVLCAAEAIRTEADVFVLIGVGGSNNGARAAIEGLHPGGRPEILYAGNTTAPWSIEEILRRMEGKSVFLNIIAKNFETLEPGAAFRVLRRAVYARYGADASRRIVATGTEGSLLHRLAQRHGWGFFPFPADMGGRYSVFSPVGLLPMAVAGVDVPGFLRGAAKMRDQLLRLPPEENPALLYAAARDLLFRAGYRSEVLTSFEPRLRWFAKWWIQLFGESAGKRGRGILPLYCECSEELHSMGQFLQDGAPVAFETFLCLREESPGPGLVPDGVEDGFSYLDDRPFAVLNAAARQAAMAAHSRHIPCLRLAAGPCNEETFGAFCYFFMLACVFFCRMQGVNPFDQPGVEAYKAEMFRILGKEVST